MTSIREKKQMIKQMAEEVSRGSKNNKNIISNNGNFDDKINLLKELEGNNLTIIKNKFDQNNDEYGDNFNLNEDDELLTEESPSNESSIVQNNNKKNKTKKNVNNDDDTDNNNEDGDKNDDDDNDDNEKNDEKKDNINDENKLNNKFDNNDEFKENILKYTRVDNIIRQKKEEIKELLQKKKPHEEYIKSYLESKNADVIKLKSCELCLNRSEKKAPLKLDIIKESIKECIKNEEELTNMNEIKCNDVVEKIIELMNNKRPVNKKVNLTRKIKKEKKETKNNKDNNKDNNKEKNKVKQYIQNDN